MNAHYGILVGETLTDRLLYTVGEEHQRWLKIRWV